MQTNYDKLKQIFKKINETKIGLYGDFCLDVYWVLDPRGSEISLETGLQAQAVKKQNYSLGGASNVAANIAALKPKELKTFGIYGSDVFGSEMISQLKLLNVNIDGFVLQKENFDTYTFSKLILNGKEQPRIDFGTYNIRSNETDEKLLENIKNSINDLDIFVINQQVPGSITNEKFIEGLNEIISENSNKIFLLDSRHFASKFKNVSYKVNNKEALILANQDSIDKKNPNENELELIAEKLFTKTNKPVFITRGENGILALDSNGFCETPGIKLDCELDIVGAGDTVFSAIACALGSRCSLQETIELANLAAAVTVQKLFQTGTANEIEILDLFEKINMKNSV
ncbi:MAG: hypothetical protein IPH62_16760 [Ignavibacteriae bacterium]|nr:hypothetical protein [Ignavibacteriota bacterium]